MSTSPTLTRRRRTIRKVVALVVMIGVASVSIAQVERSEAQALSSFDAEVLSLINEHRGDKGLNPLVHYAPLSSAALNWSNSMLAGRNALGESGCTLSRNQVDSFLRHDSGANIGSQGVPPGTVGFGENIGYACGFPGSEFGSPSWTYSGLPAKCQVAVIDYTTPLMQFCGWVNSASHRQNIESTAFTHIGLGTVMKVSGSQSEPLSTNRFVTAPVGPSCGGFAVTINMNTNGGNGNGTNGDDVILGTPNDDVINGFGGNDTMCGEAGRDVMRGGGGGDTIFGGFGIDYIWGEAGADTLDGQGGSDRMYGGPGNDLMKGDSGADRMFGGTGNDEMRGMGGQDFMWGEDGNDLMQGNFQTDNMWGGPGDDTMFGAGGKDSLFGEDGNDSLNGGNNTDYLDGGPGTDTANGGRGRDKPVVAPKVRASNGQFFDGSGCVAESITNCQA